MARKRNSAVMSPTDPEAQAFHDQEFQERLRIAEGLVQILRAAGRSCELGEMQGLRRDH
jgi:hypothetical protein